MILSHLVTNGEQQSITVVISGQPGVHVASQDHPNFEAIKRAVENQDENIVDLFDVSRTIAQRFERLSDRVSVSSGRVYFDGEEVANALTTQIVRFLDEGQDFQPLVNFWENLAANPNPHSVEHLYRWIKDRDFTITDDGYIIAYKGVHVVDGEYRSVNSGSAIVNGEKKSGKIPNPIGAVVEMARGEVTFDPANGCSTGLHAGTWDYARGFVSGPVLKVKINPRDVVSVPSDCEDQKMRVCRYTVVEEVSAPLVSALDVTKATNWYDDDEDSYNEWDEDDDPWASREY